MGNNSNITVVIFRYSKILSQALSILTSLLLSSLEQEQQFALKTIQVETDTVSKRYKEKNRYRPAGTLYYEQMNTFYHLIISGLLEFKE